jgi:hypothetical protein
MRTENKIKKIIKIISRLKAKKQVRSDEISKVLSKSQLQDIERQLENYKFLNQLERPAAIKKYAEMIRIACIFYAKMEKYHRPPVNQVLSKKFSDKAESGFENALEFIREQISNDGELQIWLDRDYRDVRGFCPVSIPRAIGSDNAECLNKNKQPYPKTSKRNLLIEILESALCELQSDTLEKFMVNPSVDFLAKKTRVGNYSEFKF